MKAVWDFIQPIILMIIGLIIAPFIAYFFLMYALYAIIYIDKLFS